MSKIKVAVAGFATALAFISAAAAGSASASWLVEKEELSAGSKAALATTAKVDELSTLLVPALKLSVVCSGGAIDGTSPEIVGGNAVRAASLTFLGCNTTVPASGCGLEEVNQRVATNPLSVLAREATTAPDAKLIVAAKTKNIITEIAFSEKNTCAFNGLEPIKGSVILNAPTLREKHTEQPIEGQGSVENNSLEVGGGNKAFLDKGKALLGLASGKQFAWNGFLFAIPVSFVFPDTIEKTASAPETFKFKWIEPFGMESPALGKAEVGNGEEIAYKLVVGGDHCNGVKLMDGGECTVEVFFEPPKEEAYQGSVRLRGTPTAEADLAGAGLK